MSDVVMVSQAAWGAVGVVSAATVTSLGVVLVAALNRRQPPAPFPPQDAAELSRLRAQLKACRQRRRQDAARIATLEARILQLDPGGPPP